MRRTRSGNSRGQNGTVPTRANKPPSLRRGRTSKNWAPPSPGSKIFMAIGICFVPARRWKHSSEAMKIAAATWLLALTCAVASAAEKVSFIKIDGAIGPATASYISRSIEEAGAQNAQCLVIQLNTPGGLLESTQTIVQSFLSSTVPVVVYVAPTGATATSAGCFITLAAHVAAMAPATTIGAAHPVSIGGFFIH